jgi:hypothetical protein
MFCVVLEFCLSSRRECRQRVFGDRVLRVIVGREWEEVTGEWRRVHNMELQGLYTSPNVIWLRSIVGHMACMEKKNAITCFGIGITHQM